MTVYLYRFGHKVKVGKIENLMASKVVPMCMDGYKYLHCTSRVPGEKIDKIVHYGDQNPTHCVVIR